MAVGGEVPPAGRPHEALYHALDEYIREHEERAAGRMHEWPGTLLQQAQSLKEHHSDFHLTGGRSTPRPPRARLSRGSGSSTMGWTVSGVFARLVPALVFKTSGGREQRPQWVRFPYTPVPMTCAESVEG